MEKKVFKSIEELDSFIINEFIPNNVRMKINYSKNGKVGKDKYPSIKLSEIVKLDLNERDFMHVLGILKREGIRIDEPSKMMDVESANCDYIRTPDSKKYNELLTESEEKEKFKEYIKTRNPELREELILRNQKLVPYVAWKIARRHNININELLSFGYEGLILAVDKFDPSINARFATYAIPCIAGAIRAAIPKLKNIPGYIYFDFQNACYIAEKDWGKKYDGDPEMLKAILDLMREQGTIRSAGKYHELESLFLGKNKISIEQLQEDDIDIVDISLDSHIERKADKHFLQTTIEREMDTLTPREKKILSLRFGLQDGRQRSLQEVAREFNVTIDRIRQIEAKAIRKLRSPERSKMLTGFLDSGDIMEYDETGMMYDASEEESRRI